MFENALVNHDNGLQKPGRFIIRPVKSKHKVN
jgi:hypothetical protein